MVGVDSYGKVFQKKDEHTGSLSKIINALLFYRLYRKDIFLSEIIKKSIIKKIVGVEV